MAGARTEKATPKKRRDARKEGRVLKSVELTSAIQMLALFGVLQLFSSYFVGKINEYFTVSLVEFKSTSGVFTEKGIVKLLLDTGTIFFEVLLPIFAVAIIVGAAVNYAQVGFLFTTKPLMPKLENINPAEGFKRMFSSKSVVELVKSILKFTVIFFIVYKEVVQKVSTYPVLAMTDARESVAVIWDSIIGVCFKIGGVLILIAILDFIYQWWKREKDLKMTKQEVKDEFKHTEGDPAIKSQRRQRQMAMSMNRMMQSVKEADVVIANPTHYAIAIKYEQGETAPKVLAKGQDYLALRIRKEAAEHGVEIVENKPLARMLYPLVEVGTMIPEEFYTVIAEILAEIYLKKESR